MEKLIQYFTTELQLLKTKHSILGVVKGKAGVWHWRPSLVLLTINLIATLGSILDSHWTGDYGKFQLNLLTLIISHETNSVLTLQKHRAWSQLKVTIHLRKVSRLECLSSSSLAPHKGDNRRGNFTQTIQLRCSQKYWRQKSIRKILRIICNQSLVFTKYCLTVIGWWLSSEEDIVTNKIGSLFQANS